MCKGKLVNIDAIENVQCPVDERETSVSFGYQDSDAQIFTSDNTVITKLKKCALKDPTAWKCYEAGRIGGSVTGYFFVTKKKNISFRAKLEKEKRVLSEEERKMLGDRLRKPKKV